MPSLKMCELATKALRLFLMNLKGKESGTGALRAGKGFTLFISN